MNDGTRFTTWKDFAYTVVDELDTLKTLYAELKDQQKKDHDNLVIIMTIFKVLGSIGIIGFGIFEFTINK